MRMRIKAPHTIRDQVGVPQFPILSQLDSSGSAGCLLVRIPRHFTVFIDNYYKIL